MSRYPVFYLTRSELGDIIFEKYERTFQIFVTAMYLLFLNNQIPPGDHRWHALLRTGQNRVEERTFFLGYAILGNVSFSTRKLRKRFLDTKRVFTTWKQRFLFAKLNSQQCFYSWPLISYSPNWQRAFTVSSQIYTVNAICQFGEYDINGHE